MSILEVQDLSLTIEETGILKNVNINIEDNRIHALVGPNGAGKSSLAFAIMGLDGYTNIDGDILFKGESLKGLDVHERAKKGITLAWQEPARFEGLTVRQFIQSASSNNGGETPESSMEKVGMEPEEYLDRPVDTSLSGGERKKIELASILAMNPKLVLLDEPDSGIDVSSLEKIFDGLQLLKEKDTTVILITHSSTAFEHAEYAYLMCDGTVVDQGDVEKIGRYFEEECFECEAFYDQEKAFEKRKDKRKPSNSE